jgi:hypothetical protein
MTAKRICLLSLVVASMFAGPMASAQVPPIPEPVADAVDQVSDTANPVLLEGASAAQPVVNAVGFALRPLCVRNSTIALALGLAGLPLDAKAITTPVAAFCRGALVAGPADPVFYQLDDAAGRDVRMAAEPVLVALNGVIEPLRAQYEVACIGVALVGPTSLPPPMSRFDPAYELCYR